MLRAFIASTLAMPIRSVGVVLRLRITLARNVLLSGHFFYEASQHLLTFLPNLASAVPVTVNQRMTRGTKSHQRRRVLASEDSRPVISMMNLSRLPITSGTLAICFP
jgi:hypothetical protein